MARKQKQKIQDEFALLEQLVQQIDAVSGLLTDTGRHSAKKILEALVAYDTSSELIMADATTTGACKSNVDLVKAMEAHFQSLGLQTFYKDEDYPPDDGIYKGPKTKQATLVVRIASEDTPQEGGVVLSGHTDVVPVPAQETSHWSINGNPFRLAKDGTNQRFIGRGTVDMKQGIYNMLAIAELYSDKKKYLKKPVYLAFSWGEEIGCQGTKTVVDMLKKIQATPDLVIVGEPTKSELVVGHKGAANIRVGINPGQQLLPDLPFKEALLFGVTSIGGHSSIANRFVNATEYAARLNEKVHALEDIYKASGKGDVVIKCVSLDVGPSPNSVPSYAGLRVYVGTKNEGTKKKIITDLLKIRDEVSKELKADTVNLGKALTKEAREQNREIDTSHLDPNKSEILYEETEVTSIPYDHTRQIDYACTLYRQLEKLQGSYRKIQEGRSNGFDPPYPIINFGRVSIDPMNPEANFGIHIRPIDDGHTIEEQIEGLVRELGRATDINGTFNVLTRTRALIDQRGIPDQALFARKSIIERLCEGIREFSGEDHKAQLVSYATEAGGISEQLGGDTATVVYGVGDIDRAHKIDEHLTFDELQHSLQFPLWAIGELCVNREMAPDIPSTKMYPTGSVKVERSKGAGK